MAGRDIELGIRITADGRVAVTEGGKVTAALKGIETQSRKTAQAAGQMDKAFATAARSVTALAASYVSLQSGKALLDSASAADRLAKGFATITGSAQGAAKQLEFARTTAQTLGLSLNETSLAYLKMAASAKGSALEGEKTQAIFTAVSRAAAALGLSADESSGALYAIGQMMSKGTVATEELRGQLGERLPGAFQIAARAMGVSTAELSKMLEQGQVLADDFLPRFAAELDKTYSAARFDGIVNQVNRVSNAWEQFKKTLADSVPIKAGLQAVEDALNSALDASTISKYLNSAEELQRQLTELSVRGAQSSGIFGSTLFDRAQFDEEIRTLGAKIRDAKHLTLDEWQNTHDAMARQLAEFEQAALATVDPLMGAWFDAVISQIKQGLRKLDETRDMVEARTGDPRRTVLGSTANILELQPGSSIDARARAQRGAFGDKDLKAIQQSDNAAAVAAARRSQNVNTLVEALTRQMQTEKGLSYNAARHIAQQEVRGDQDAANERSMHKSATAAEKLSGKLSDLYTKYQDELNVIGLTGREAEIYKARHDAMADGAKDAGDAAAKMAGQIYDAKKALEEESRAAGLVADAFKDAKLQQDLASANLGELQKLQGQGLTGDALKKAFDERKTYIETQTKALYDGMDQTNAATLAQIAQDTEHTNNQIGETWDKSADSFTETWKNAVKRLDDVFANFWKGLLSGSGDFMGSLKSLLTDFAAEFLHNTFTRPLTNLFSGGGTAAGAPTFSLWSLFGSGGGSASSGLGGGGLSGGSGGSGSGLSGIFDVFSGASSLSSLWGGLSNFVGFSDAAMNMYKLGGFGFSSTLGNFGLKAANFLGLGAGGTGALAGGFGYSPWGALGSLGASLLGAKGGIGTSIGGALGGFGGGALAGAAASGALGATMAGLAAIPGFGPFLAILGGLGGSFMGSLFGSKPKTPKASATYSLSATNLKTLTSAWQKNKGPLDAMKSGSSSLVDSLAALEEEFDVEFGPASASMWSRKKKGGFSVSVLGQSFSANYKNKNTAYIQAMFEQMQMWALRLAKDQIDDQALRVSIGKRSTVAEVVEDKKAIADIRLFTGEWSGLRKTLEDMAKTFEKMRGTAAFLEMDMTKLHQGYARAMIAQRDDLSAKTAAVLGQDADPGIAARARENDARDLYTQIKDYNAALLEENDDARRDTGALLTDLAASLASTTYSYSVGRKKRRRTYTVRDTEAETAIDALLGQARALQALDLSQSGAGDAFNKQATALGSALSAASTRFGGRYNLSHLADFAKTLHAADMSLSDSTAARYTEAQFMEAALKQQQKERYAAELDYIARIKDYADSLLLSGLSTLSPEEQFRRAQGDYGTALLKGQALDKESLANLPSLAEQYLTHAKSYYASSTSYAEIFDSVRAALGNLKVPGFATGGLASGWAMVGEQGPELVNFQNPGRVYTAQETRAAFGSDQAAASVERLIRVQQDGNRRIIERLNAMDGRLAGLESSARLDALAA